MTICDAILDNYLDERRQKGGAPARRLALEARAKKSRHGMHLGRECRNAKTVVLRTGIGPKASPQEIEIEAFLDVRRR